MPAPSSSPTMIRPAHSHRWRIEEPSGPLSQGHCLVCGAVREFRNWLQESDLATSGAPGWLEPALRPGLAPPGEGDPGW